MRLHAAAPAALAPLLAAELESLGARRVRARGAGVEFEAEPRTAYRACLWSRLASRILLTLARVPAADGDALYHGARALEWEAHMDADTSFAVHCSVRDARIGHSHFAALRVKDAIVDRFREREGRRPPVDTRAPRLRVHLHLRGAEGRLAIDLAGAGLHRRGYRTESGAAPLRETLAAGLLSFAGWPDPARCGQALLDPLCGSGTLLVEAAMMAADVAPGLLREESGIVHWRGPDGAQWDALLDEARERRARGLARLPDLRGSDHDPRAVAIAARALARAGFAGRVAVATRPLSAYLREQAFAARGLLVTNPPYGDRLDAAAAARCRRELEALAGGSWRDWRVALLLPDDGGWPSDSEGSVALAVRNGALRCRFHVLPGGRAATVAADAPAVDTAALENRLRKNLRRLAGWRAREDVRCFRAYDADLPEFAFALDVYDADRRWLHAQEYAPPADIPAALADARRGAALAAAGRVLEVPPERIVCKTRERQRGRAQYGRHDDRGDFLEVTEHGVRLLVELHDHLDTGLFLDHRPVRRWIREHAAGKRFLNLFAYTGAASVHAAAGGARTTLSVDLSATYVARAERNLALNGFAPPRHRCVRADCLDWLHSPQARASAPFDLVFVDPPTFSNSKRMRRRFDVQRDHVELLRAAAELLAGDATLIFSSNRRGFRLDRDALADFDVRDWTRPSVPPDFARPALPHCCFMLSRRAG